MVWIFGAKQRNGRSETSVQKALHVKRGWVTLSKKHQEESVLPFTHLPLGLGQVEGQSSLFQRSNPFNVG